jgi:hypothetical protein
MFLYHRRFFWRCFNLVKIGNFNYQLIHEYLFGKDIVEGVVAQFKAIYSSLREPQPVYLVLGS